jgi:hypothetical protein
MRKILIFFNGLFVREMGFQFFLLSLPIITYPYYIPVRTGYIIRSISSIKHSAHYKTMQWPGDKIRHIVRERWVMGDKGGGCESWRWIIMD